MEARLDQLEMVINTIAMQGNPNSPFWFMGLEESTDVEISADDQILKQYGVAMAQNNGVHAALTCARERTTYLPSWGGYIKLLFSVRDALLGSGARWSLVDVKDYQRKKLGDLTVEEYSTCLLEFSPLPRKTRSHTWIYEKIAHRPGFEFLKTHEIYSKHSLVTERGAAIMSAVKQYQPRILFVFGKDGENILKLRVNNLTSYDVVKNDKGQTLPARIGAVDTSLIVFSYHPGALPPERYWRELGATVAGILPPAPETAA